MLDSDENYYLRIRLYFGRIFILTNTKGEDMNLSREDKIAVAARNFYDDQVGTEDAFDNYEQAVDELSKVSDDFIDTVVSFVKTEIKDGYRTLIKDGYLIQVNSETGHVLPISAMTQEQGEEIQKEFEQVSEQYNEIESAIVLLQKMGWKLT